MTSEYRTYRPNSAEESLVPAINLAGSMGVAAFAILVWGFGVPFCGGSAGAARIYNGVYAAVSLIALVLGFVGIISTASPVLILQSVLLASCSITAVIPSLSVLMEGPQGAGSAAAGVGWLIALAVFATGVFGLSAALLTFARAWKLRKRSQKPNKPLHGTPAEAPSSST